jgi:hypothetical protein
MFAKIKNVKYTPVIISNCFFNEPEGFLKRLFAKRGIVIRIPDNIGGTIKIDGCNFNGYVNAIKVKCN